MRMENSTIEKPLCYMRSHWHKIQLAALFVLVLFVGLAIGNYHVTKDALSGQANYFVHTYTPKVAGKAAGAAIRKAQEDCPTQ
jgi:hypothetical protein